MPHLQDVPDVGRIPAGPGLGAALLAETAGGLDEGFRRALRVRRPIRRAVVLQEPGHLLAVYPLIADQVHRRLVDQFDCHAIAPSVFVISSTVNTLPVPGIASASSTSPSRHAPTRTSVATAM